MRGFSLLFSFLFVFTTGAQAAPAPKFNTQEGPVAGIKTTNGAFYPNIPYAQPPVESLRWKAPRPPEKRNGIWDGQRLNVKSAQKTDLFSGVKNANELGLPAGSEDSLYLNVWVPRKTASKEKLPVIVWFHGGSNRQGYASDPLYDGEVLAEKTDAIVVSVNYRLGLFGALYHEALKSEDPADSSGNFVTLDGIRALEWIRENIADVGGDAERITIAGESAGCINVWGLIQSPLAKNLFQQAYCASGLPNTYSPAEAEKNANEAIKSALIVRKEAADLDEAAKILSAMDNSEIKKFLYSLSTQELLQIPLNFIPIQHIADGHVLPRNGMTALTLGDYNAVPMMVSSTGNEGSYFFLRSYAGLNKKDFWSVLTGKKTPAALTKLIRSEKFKEFKARSDRFTYGFNQLIDSVSVAGQMTIPAIYRMRMEWGPSKEPWKSAFGAAHGTDLPLIFAKKDLGENHVLSFLNKDLKDPKTTELVNKFLTYLKGFIHTGNPNAFSENAPRWHQWSALLPSNMIFNRDEVKEKLHYFNPLVGAYALARSIADLNEQDKDSDTEPQPLHKAACDSALRRRPVK